MGRGEEINSDGESERQDNFRYDLHIDRDEPQKRYIGNVMML